MRFDMHCHTKEGSPDGKIPLRDYVLRLKELGYDGMMITDHNSYKAYRHYLKIKDDPVFQNFTVLKGIEYDTCDAGHILVVMPENVRMPILELRGLPVRLLIEIVHTFHGILGPAHPTGEKYLSITNFKIYHRNPDILREFDFMEAYNSCISPEANRRAAALAEQYNLPGTGGSDAHKIDCVGLAFTDFAQPIHTETDLIRYFTVNSVPDDAVTKTADGPALQLSGSSLPNSGKCPVLTCGGRHYSGTTRDHLGLAYDLLLKLYYVYSKAGNFIKRSRLEVEVVYLLSVSDKLLQRIRGAEFLNNLPKKVKKEQHWKELEDELLYRENQHN
ncbi:MAG: PHP domain-containing protein [Clostridiales bacterium]|nr:PHP domain-containing protein [Clostridiales bacterium]